MSVLAPDAVARNGVGLPVLASRRRSNINAKFVRNRIDAKPRPSAWDFGTVIEYRRDQTVFIEGETCEHYFKVSRGAVRLCVYSHDGMRQIVDFAFAGEYFGLCPTDHYIATGEAASRAALVRYSRPRMDAGESFSTSRLLLLLSTQFISMQDHLSIVGVHSADARVAKFLLRVFLRLKALRGETFEIPVSRRDIADYVNLSMETVCRSIASLRHRRIIDVPSAHELVVRKIEALRALAKDGSFDLAAYS